MEPFTPSVIWSLCGAIFGGGAAYGAVRHQLQEATKDHEELKSEFIAHKRQDDTVHKDMIDRTARIETKIDMLLEKRL